MGAENAITTFKACIPCAY